MKFKAYIEEIWTGKPEYFWSVWPEDCESDAIEGVCSSEAEARTEVNTQALAYRIAFAPVKVEWEFEL